MKIRKAKKSDMDEISDLFRIEYSKSPYNKKWTKTTARKTIYGYYDKKHIFFVVDKDNKIIGFVIGHIYNEDNGKRGFVDEIVVGSMNQGKGYGGLLMKEIENYFKDRKIKISVLTSYSNSKAFKIYKKLGYRENKLITLEKRIR